ncbi:m-AAA protease-interacting protein 1, mitochondrial isoform X2 [Harmonia axyridis]|nr:m-AAA protease-interacting protein 1, mitochondrial isoform X2 [Harmonia axyridis]XP_045460939.1 m-AAA protease-interacting protein 1, mitochondrial isoform X2 [Harmonia axyridis]
MNFPRVMWPSIPKALKNTILSYFIIKPYMDLDFDLGEVVLGSKKAVDVVSKKLSSGEDLGQLVTDDIIPVLQSRVSIMSVAQKELLAIDEKDIYFSFPYQVGIIFNENESNPKRFVEILMVHHSLKGLNEMRERGEEIPMNIGVIPEYRNKICVANYRFIKEFTKGIQDDWTINSLNHFNPADELDGE